MDVVIQKAENPSQQPTKVKKRRKVSGVHCTVYKPFEQRLASLNLPSSLGPLFEELGPEPGFFRIWPDEDEDIPLVETKYGLVPRGSALPISRSKQVKVALNTLHTQCQILTFQIWGTCRLCLLRKSCCTSIPLEYLWIKPLNMNE